MAEFPRPAIRTSHKFGQTCAFLGTSMPYIITGQNKFAWTAEHPRPGLLEKVERPNQFPGAIDGVTPPLPATGAGARSLA